MSLSKDYVPDWTVVDGVRELFQNALDQQTANPDNKMFFKYNENEGTLYIGNKLSTLDVKTLLLGASTKRDDPNTIGQFGEGYKIATLVLTRLNKKVTFYNYGAREVWRPRFVNSRRYGTEILTFFVDKKYIWQRTPDNDLTITVENITLDEYNDIIDSNLHLQDVGKTLNSQFGRILYEERYKGKVFVNGLFVCDYNKYNHGYDFKPRYIKIDRDRKLADSFELRWLSSKMWSGVDNEHTIELIKQGASDVEYITSASYSSTTINNIADKAYNKFKREHGNNAIPVTSHEEFSKYSGKGNDITPVFVNESYSNVIKSSPKYEEPKIKLKKEQTVKSKLEKWLKDHSHVLTKRAKSKLQAIIDEIYE